MGIGDGLMSLGINTIDSVNKGIDEYYDKVDEGVAEAEQKAAQFLLDNTNRGADAIRSEENFYNNLTRNRKNNFNQILSEYGPDKLEELNVLSEARPDLFSGDLAQSRLMVQAFIEDRSAPNIDAQGNITVPRFDQSLGTTQFVPLEGEGADFYKQSIFGREKITGAELFKRQTDELKKNVFKGYGDNYGLKSAELHLGSFAKASSPAKEIIETKRDFNTGLEISPSQVTESITEIVNRQMLSDPFAITRGQIVSATNWYPVQNYDTLYAKAYTDNRGNALGTQSDVLNFSIQMLNAIEERDGQGAAQSAVDSGAFTSDSVMAVIMSNPAVEMSRIALEEGRKIDMTLNKDINAGEIALNIPTDERSKEQTAAIIKMKGIQADYYRNAQLTVQESGFYTRKNEFINLVTPNEFPSELGIKIKGKNMLIIPNPLDGLVKIVPSGNAADDSESIRMHVRSFVREEKGGYAKDGSDGQPNLYYNEKYGYDKKTGINNRFETVQQHFIRNDAFGINFVDQLRGNIK